MLGRHRLIVRKILAERKISAFRDCRGALYRRANHANLHVRGYKEEGTITTPFDMTVLNDLDRFHLVMDAIDRLPQTGDKGVYLKQRLADKLIEHKAYIEKYGEDMPEIRDWTWS